jgi:hypothetical protein
MKAPVLGGRSQAFSHVGDTFDGGDARQKHVRSGFGRHEGCETCYLDRRAPICLRYHEMLPLGPGQSVDLSTLDEA